MPSDEVIDALLNPRLENAQKFLRKLKLDRLPTKQEILRDIEDGLLKPKLPDLHFLQVHWEQEVTSEDWLEEQIEVREPTSRLELARSGLEGEIVGWKEVTISNALTSTNSTSADRLPGSRRDFVRGKSGNVPFWPGGLEAPSLEKVGDLTDHEQLGLGGKLKTRAPGFKRGLRLPGEALDEEEEDLNLEVEDAPGFKMNQNGDMQPDSSSDTPHDEPEEEFKTEEIDAFLPIEDVHIVPTPRSLRTKPPAQKRDWAHVIDVSRPFNDFHEKVPDMAHKYPFELDPFQKHAVYHLEQGDSVFVAAHTSAGKTVVAEYAIALANRHMTRAIYTSPIKALSNQKFRDFQSTFSSSQIGILTGDVQINPEAPCLIMTTEILRSMLYKGADLIRDVEFVVFDEVHYVSDAERGVVWEEVIIMLPEHVSIILLSATIPNTREFAEWVGRTKKKDIYVMSTLFRPVPLEHYLYAGRETYKIVDQKGQFISQGYKDAGEALRRKQDKEREAAGLPPVQRLGAAARANPRGGPPGRGGPTGRGGARGGRGQATFARGGAPTRTFHSVDKNLYVHLLGHLRKKSLLPVVVFVFSKKRCEENASTLVNADLCSAVEKSQIHVEIEKALSRLKGTDKQLPQIARMKELLSRGIGVHHGGLLPIVKEVVEMLFGRGLVKILFATETFAMGVNMPARCVVFSGMRKHDGRSFRDLLPGEYTQMSGRAGRRGLDTTGTVIIACDDQVPEASSLSKMMLGKPANLQSQFRLTYNMILNLLRVEALRVEEMIKRSFSENAAQSLLPDQQKQITEEERALSRLPTLQCDVCEPDMQAYYAASVEHVRLTQQLTLLASQHPRGSKWFAPGRVVVIRNGHFPACAAVMLKPAPFQGKAKGSEPRDKAFFVLAMVSKEVKDKHSDDDGGDVPPRAAPSIHPESLQVSEPVYHFREVRLSDIIILSDRVIKVDLDAIVERRRISHMKLAIEQLVGVVNDWIRAKSIREVDFDKIKGFEFQDAYQKRGESAMRLEGRSCTLCGDFGQHFNIHHALMIMGERIRSLKFFISDQNLELLPDYEQRVDVLRELQFITESGTVSLKGRVACEINSADELVLTELILENTLSTYSPGEVVALLSCFVFQEKTDVEPVVPPKLQEGRDAILQIADKVGKVQDHYKVSTEDFERKFKFGLLEVVWEWARGMPFEQIMMLTDIAEGTIVRVITRLDETCREVRDAARVIGDAELFKKMEEAQSLIRRDIVFAASLYF